MLNENKPLLRTDKTVQQRDIRSLNASALMRMLAGLLVFLMSWGSTETQAQPQTTQFEPTSEVVSLTLDEAIQIAYVNSYTLRDARLGVEEVRAQVQETRGQLYPQFEISSSYTRNIKNPNPFSGSSANNLFSGLGFLEWLSFNEQARTDFDASTEPLSFAEFALRQQQGLDDAGIVLETDDNPFAVPNQFTTGITVTQTLLDFSAFIAVKGAARYAETSQQNGLERQEQLLIDNVKTAFFQGLLASEQYQVAGQSVGRTKETLGELARQVSQGVTPKFQRLTAEVELANLETALFQSENAMQTALDQLKLVLGIPVEQPIRLVGTLATEDEGSYMTINAEDAVGLALQHRPDLKQLSDTYELQRLNARVTRTRYLPTLSAVANYSYIGNVPSNRTSIFSDPSDPFSFSQQTNGFFSDSYWDESFSVGFQLNWQIFDGFQNRNRARQQQIQANRTQNQYEQQLQSIRQEVSLALRNLDVARQQILSQERNVERAELSYSFAKKRLEEGVSNPLEERNASEQLDQSRLNYLQAIHDFLRAKSAFETAVGMPMGNPEDFRMAQASSSP